MPTRFRAGDSLRGIAAVAVVAIHCLATVVVVRPLHPSWLTAAGRLPLRFVESLNLAVAVFFTLSAYLLARPFLAAYVEGAPLPRIRPYLRNRAERILPGAYVAIVCTVAVFGRDGTGPGHLLAVPLFAQVYAPSWFALGPAAHLWTVDAELVFYLLLPLAASALVAAAGPRADRATRRRTAAAATVLAALLSIATAQLLLPGEPYWRMTWFPCAAYAFAPGVLLALLATGRPDRLLASPRGRWIPAALAAAAVPCFAYWMLTVEHPVVWLRLPAGMLAAGCAVAAALTREWQGAAVPHAVDNAALRWLGARSYSLYLFHLIVLAKVVRPLVGTGPGAFVLAVPLTLLLMVPVAALGYELVERPFLARRRSWQAAASSDGHGDERRAAAADVDVPPPVHVPA